MEDPDDDEPIFHKGWKPKKTEKTPDDDEPIFHKGWKPKKTMVAIHEALQIC